MPATRVGIVGAGPGGLTSAMILAKRGFDVTVFERKNQVGGRNGPLRLGDYTFDTGPTFLMMKYILEAMFAEAGHRVEDHLEIKQVDPLYRLKFGNVELMPSADRKVTREQIRKHFPGNEAGLDAFMDAEKRRFEYLFPCLQKDYGSLGDYLDPVFLKALPRMSLGRSMFQNLGRYFDNDDLKLCFTFQSKYLGMSPWTCPAFFTMLSYIEHAHGVYHVTGGLNRISQAMADVTRANGGTIRLETPVKQLWVEGRAVRGVVLEDGAQEPFDDVVLNADFGHAMETLAPPGAVRKYAPGKLKKWKLSCSTFMIYLGLNKTYPGIPHHSIVFADDYQRNVADITDRGTVSEDASFYVQNASVTDPTLAPEGRSTIYILVPCPNTRAGIDWPAKAESYANHILDLAETRGGYAGLRENVEEKKIVTPAHWVDDYGVYEGATFNLAHTMLQTLYFRPHNRFEELEHCYLVGGGTHPGSGLPTIYESGRISSNLLCRDRGVSFEPPASLEAMGVQGT
jgi:phytoene desaturase